MSPQRHSSLFGDRHTRSYTHTERCILYTHSVMIHQSSEVGYACHFRSLYPLRCINSPSSFTNLAFVRLRSPSHPGHTAPYAMPHCGRGIKRRIKSKLWPYPHQHRTDTSRDGRLAATYGHVPSQPGHGAELDTH